MKCACGLREETLPCGAQGELAQGNNPNNPLPCSVVCRNARLREALKLPETKSVRPEIQLPPYSSFLKSFARRFPSFTLQLETSFKEFVENEKSGSFTFPPMNTEKRAVVHQLAAYYFVESQSQDAPPNRSVIIYRTPLTFLPPYTLTESLDRPEEETAYKYGICIELTPDLRVRDIENVLRPWHNRYFLQLNNEFELCVWFTNRKLAESAIQALNRSSSIQIFSRLVTAGEEQREGDGHASFEDQELDIDDCDGASSVRPFSGTRFISSRVPVVSRPLQRTVSKDAPLVSNWELLALDDESQEDGKS
jgi:hypothetical protein